MRRREFITLLGGGAAAWPLAARAQQAGKLPIIGFLGVATSSTWKPWVAAFVQRLRELGWVDGQSTAIEYRWAEGRSERFDEIVAEFVRLNVDVIVTAGSAVPAAKRATSVIPIVFALAPDPIGSGLVASLARPGGNVTGLSNQSGDLFDKRLEILREIIPGLRRLGIIANRDNPQVALEISDAQDKARKLGIDVTISNIVQADDIAPAIDALKGNANSLYVVSDAFAVTNRVRINTFALAARMPTMHANREYIETGGLISYGTNYPDLFRRAGNYVDKILRGAKPADLPVEQPTKFDLVINLDTAKALGVEVPAVAARPRRRGDRVIWRREFIAMLGGAAAAWPLAARAQQPAMPVVGFVHAGSSDAPLAAAFRKGLNDAGYVEGQNVTVEYHWLEGHFDRLPALMADLVRRGVAVIATPAGNAAALAAKAATTTIPIVFGVSEDPVKLGLVASLRRPGGNLTGINFFATEFDTKRLALLHELVPKAIRIAVLVNPANVPATESTLRAIPEAARAIGLQIEVLNASTSREIEAAFASLVRDGADALYVAGDAFFTSRRVQFATLAASYRIPAAYPSREAVEVGGLMGYDNRSCGHVASGRRLHRSSPEGRQARRSAGATVNKIRVRHQPANGQGARPRNLADFARPCWR